MEANWEKSSAGRGLRAIALAALAVGVIVAAPRPAHAGPYKDDKLGFQVTPPAKWKPLPISPDEKWVACSFSCDREFTVDDAKTNSRDVHRPQLDVVVLPLTETEKKGGVTVEKTDSGGVSISIDKARYKDFKDYLDQTMQRGSGGFFFSKEEEQKVGDIKVMFYEITVDKLANAPKKRWGWAFYAPDAIYGITGDALIKFEDKVRPDIEAAFRSFKVISHTAALGGVSTGKGGDIVIKDPGKKLTPEEKRKSRDDDFNAYLARLKETLPKDWKIKETEHYVGVTHCDDKYTKETLDHAEALRGWLDKSLAVLGDAIPGKVIVRMCASRTEYDAMWNTGGAASYRFEIYTFDNKEAMSDSKLWTLNWGLYRMWLSAKNADLGGRMPVWLDAGLRECVKTAITKGKDVEFKQTQRENEDVAVLTRAKDFAAKLITAKNFLTQDTETLVKTESAALQAECFCRYLLVGGAQKNAKYKLLLTSYLTNFVAMVKEQSGEKDTAKADKEPQTEEEENAVFRERQNRWKEKEKETLQKLVDKTFTNWEDKDWDAFNKSYWRELGV